MFASDRTCCVCRIPGRSVQIHHINGNRGDNRDENLAIICLQCHDDAHRKGGSSRRLDERTVAKYRSDWLTRVANRREAADRAAVDSTVRSHGASQDVPDELSIDRSSVGAARPVDFGDHKQAVEYVKQVPSLRARLKARVSAGSAGSTADSLNAAYDYIDNLREIAIRLARISPNEFFYEDPDACLSDITSGLYRLYRLRYTMSDGTGTIVNQMVVGSVMRDVEDLLDAIEDFVRGELVDTNGG